MKPDISEFSYGYALTDDLIHWNGTSLTAAPVFPSLYEEGQPGGGYDVMLQRPGLPLFLQFKLSDCMVRDTAREVNLGLLAAPFYRMHIRPARHSEQHEMLLDLERAGNEVYYSAPAFHTPEELNNAYFAHQVKNRSFWVRPSVIGPLPDDRDHHVAFTVPGRPFFLSKPKQLDTRGDFGEFAQQSKNAFLQKGGFALKNDSLAKSALEIRRIAEKRSDISLGAKLDAGKQLDERHPLAVISFYATTFMGCQLFIVRER